MITGGADFYRADPRGILISVRLTPKAARDSLDGVAALADGRAVLRARVRAVPEKGVANRALCDLLAKALGVPKSAVEVVAGATARLKQVRVTGRPEELAPAIDRLAGGHRADRA